MSAKDSLMQASRTLGRLPKEATTATKDEQQLAERLRRARRAGQLSGEEEAELSAMSANDSLMQVKEGDNSGVSQPARAGKPADPFMQAMEEDNRGASQPGGAGKPADPSCRPFEFLEGCPKRAEQREQTAAALLRLLHQAPSRGVPPGHGSRQQRRFSACWSGKAS